MAIVDYLSLIARVRAYTGYDETDISDSFIEIFLDDAVGIMQDEVSHTFDETSHHDCYMISIYACGSAVNYVNGPNIKKVEVGDTKVTFDSPKGGIASNEFLEEFWAGLLEMEEGGGLTKSTWDLSKTIPTYKGDQKRYRRIDEKNTEAEEYWTGDIIVIEEGDGVDV